MNATTIDSMFGVTWLAASVSAKATTGAAVVVVFDDDAVVVVVARSEDVVVVGTVFTNILVPVSAVEDKEPAAKFVAIVGDTAACPDAGSAKATVTTISVFAFTAVLAVKTSVPVDFVQPPLLVALLAVNLPASAPPIVNAAASSVAVPVKPAIVIVSPLAIAEFTFKVIVNVLVVVPVSLIVFVAA
jgi:hypothetical protein